MIHLKTEIQLNEEAKSENNREMCGLFDCECIEYILHNINSITCVRQDVSFYSLKRYGTFNFMVNSNFNPCLRISKLPVYTPKAERSFDTHD